VLAALIIGRASLSGYGAFAESWSASRDLAERRLGSDISLNSVAPNGFEVTAVVDNDGATPIETFADMDVLVHWVAGGAQLVQWLPNTSPSLAPNTWRVSTILNDGPDAGVLDNGESLVMEICLEPPADPGSTNWLQVTSGFGTSASAVFTGVANLGPCPP
jgi:hypothetical protein